MNADRNDQIDRVLDEVLASMVQGEPRRVSGASVRQAVGEGRGFKLPVWLIAAAVLVVALGVVLKGRAPATEVPIVAQSVPSPSPAEVRSAPSPNTHQGKGATPGRTMTASRTTFVLTAEAPYEGLPRLTIASIDPLEPLSTGRLSADPILIPRIEIPPLSVSTLSTEPENKQEPLQ